MAYADYLAARGYRRVVIERTIKQPGDLILGHNARPLERVPGNVVAMRRKRGQS